MKGENCRGRLQCCWEQARNSRGPCFTSAFSIHRVNQTHAAWGCAGDSMWLKLPLSPWPDLLRSSNGRQRVLGELCQAKSSTSYSCSTSEVTWACMVPPKEKSSTIGSRSPPWSHLSSLSPRPAGPSAPSCLLRAFTDSSPRFQWPSSRGPDITLQNTASFLTTLLSVLYFFSVFFSRYSKPLRSHVTLT